MVLNQPQNGQPEASPAFVSKCVVGETVFLLKIPGVRVNRQDILVLLRTGLTEGEGMNGIRVNGNEIHVCHATDTPKTYVYFSIRDQAGESGEAGSERRSRVRRGMETACRAVHPEADARELTVTQVVPGAAAGRSPGWHYVVETDVLASAEQDFNDWYSQEHLPGLAAVPGCVCAMRLQQLEGSPRYHALYLLETRETFGSEAWLKVRATDWSSRVRPNFTNTKRTMFEIAGGMSAGQ